MVRYGNSSPAEVALLSLSCEIRLYQSLASVSLPDLVVIDGFIKRHGDRDGGQGLGRSEAQVQTTSPVRAGFL